MSVNKDMKTGTWTVQLRLKDRTGKIFHKKRRGFPTKREATEWEADFRLCFSGSCDMRFRDFCALYMADSAKRLKPSTFSNRQYIMQHKILPHFAEKPLLAITPADIRWWQNSLRDELGKNGKPYQGTYLRTIHGQLSALFNYAVKYYGLPENPCRKAGSIGNAQAEEMRFWTKEEFDRFLSRAKDKPQSYAAFLTLYYTGLRKGELLALTPADLDFAKSVIHVRKNFIHVHGQDIISTPKTRGSIRDVTIPERLEHCLRDYLREHPEIGADDRIFPFSVSYLGRELDRISALSGVKRIRVHDIRHPYVKTATTRNFKEFFCIVSIAVSP